MSFNDRLRVGFRSQLDHHKRHLQFEIRLITTRLTIKLLVALDKTPQLNILSNFGAEGSQLLFDALLRHVKVNLLFAFVRFLFLDLGRLGAL